MNDERTQPFSGRIAIDCLSRAHQAQGGLAGARHLELE
jgi:hypothetical protein